MRDPRGEREVSDAKLAWLCCPSISAIHDGSRSNAVSDNLIHKLDLARLPARVGKRTSGTRGHIRRLPERHVEVQLPHVSYVAASGGKCDQSNNL
jgi:hypothetical protein